MSAALARVSPEANDRFVDAGQRDHLHLRSKYCRARRRWVVKGSPPNGILIQSAALFDSFTLNDNLALPLTRFRALPKSEMEARVQKTLDAVGLGNDRKKMPAEFSGGMRKRAGLARALVLEPSILLVDEPSSGLDRVT